MIDFQTVVSLYATAYGSAYAVSRDVNLARRAALEAVFSLYEDYTVIRLPDGVELKKP